MKDMPPNRDTMFENGGRPSTSDIMLGIIFVWKVPHGHMYNYRHYVQYSKNINLASRQHVGDYCMLVLRMRGYGSHLNHLIGKLAGTLAVGWSDIGFFCDFRKRAPLCCQSGIFFMYPIFKNRRIWPAPIRCMCGKVFTFKKSQGT